MNSLRLTTLGIFTFISLGASALIGQSVPTGYQDFRIVGNEEHVWEVLRDIAIGEGRNSFDDNTTGGFLNVMSSVVTLTASADSQVVFYDHWEDGFESVFPCGGPTLDACEESTTLVLGDGNPLNGRACEYTTDPRVDCDDPETEDVLFRGTSLTLNSNQSLPVLGPCPTGQCIARAPQPDPGGDCSSVIPAPPLDERCSVPLPRNPEHIRFDGGDRLITSGGPISLVHTQDPLSGYIGGASEVIPREAVENATSYTIPIGVDLYDEDEPTTASLFRVFLEIVAYDDDTNVTITSPGAGVVSFTLDAGQHYSSMGFIEGTFFPGLEIPINAGAKVATSSPISGMILTGGPVIFSARFYLLLPDVLHGTDYITTAPGDDPTIPTSTGPADNPGTGGAVPNRPLNLYIVNPDPFNEVVVNTVDTLGSRVFTIPPGEAVNYFDHGDGEGGAGRYVPSGSTVRLTSDRQFWGVSAYDSENGQSDWGHSWIATKFLQTEYTISFAPGTNNPVARLAARPPECLDLEPASGTVCNSDNRSPVFVAATQNNTRVRIDLNGNGVFDVVDVNGDDIPDPANVTPTPMPPGWVNGPDATTYIVNELRALKIFDHTDYDNTGTIIVADKPVAVSNGQDTDQGQVSDRSLDFGYVVFQAVVEAVLTLEKVADPVSVPTTGGVVTYTVTLNSGDVGPLTDVGVTDLLPLGVSCADYISGTSLVTYPNFSQSTADPACALDVPSGRNRLTWAFPFPADSLPRNQRITIRYQIDIPAGPVAVLTNDAQGQGTLGGSVFRPTASANVTRTDVTIEKSVEIAHPGIAEPGAILTYTLEVTNAGAAAETNVTILDAIPPDTTFVTGTITSTAPFSGTYLPGSNSVQWTGTPVSPGSYTLTFDVQINPTAAAGDIITNQASYSSLQTPVLFSNVVETPISAPAITILKTGPAGPLYPGQTVDWQLVVTNPGSATATNVTLIDPVATNSTYVSGSMTWRRNALPFVPVTDANDADAGTLLAGPTRTRLIVGNLGPGESATFRFRVQVNVGTAGQFLPNQATVSSTEVPPTDSNLIQLPIVGTVTVTGHVFLDLDGDAVLDVGEPGIPNVDVLVTDPWGNPVTVTTDTNGNWFLTVTRPERCYEDTIPAVAYNGSTGNLTWSSSWTEFGTGSDASPATTPMSVDTPPVAAGTFVNSLRIQGNGAGRGFSRAADLATFNAASLSFSYLRVQGEGSDTLTIQVDYDNNGTFESTLQTIAGANDAAWQSASLPLNPLSLPANPIAFRFVGVSNQANEVFWIDNIRLCDLGSVSTNVQESDPDFPPGAVLTTDNDPQGPLGLPISGTLNTGNVGYQPPPLQISKTSNAGGEVFPGQIVTYTIEVSNSSSVTQTNLSVSDALPTGTSFVPASGFIQRLTPTPTFRTREYPVASTTTQTQIDLLLDQALVPNYFVMIQGSSAGTQPGRNYLALTNDPFGTGDFAGGLAANLLRFTRQGSASSAWTGVITVVECLSDCGTSGFELLDARRISHTGTTTSGSVTATSWLPSRVMLLGGHRGAGCDTATTTTSQHPACQARFFPSGTNTIEWTRGASGTAAATSTVQVIQWGSEWTVQNVNVTGTNAGGGVDATGEYNTATIASVNRDNTWVWGRGHTSLATPGAGGEALVYTLGDGVSDSSTPAATVAVGLEVSATKATQVWAISHQRLRVDYRKAAGASGSTQQDQTVDAATSASGRFAVAFNGLSTTSNDNHARGFVAARYFSDTSVRLTRNATGTAFPTWVQGVDVSRITHMVASSLGASGTPPALISSGAGISLAPGESIVVTFQVQIDPALSQAITSITNTATAQTTLQGPVQASVTDDVVRLGVVVEYNNAAFAEANAPAPQYLLFAHDVVNTGNVADSYDITVSSLQGWQVELIDPTTGAVLAIDTNGDGDWDIGGPIATGPLAPGARRLYDLRVRVPAGTPLGTQDTVQLTAQSQRNPLLYEFSTDEIEVVDLDNIGPIVLLPDNSGVVNPDESIVYSHYVVNNTGANATINLQAVNVMDGAANPEGWSATIYGDTNNDGVYTPGVDLVIANTANLPHGASQQFFVVVDSPAGAEPGDTVVTVLTASLQGDPDTYDGGSDTTTVMLPSSHDLSGGGTRLVDVGDNPIFPGTLFNQGTASDTFEILISPSAFFGVDPFLHPTHLWIDTTGDGVVDTPVASDTNGDGTWDFIDPMYDGGMGLPELIVPGGSGLFYELRRPVDPNQTTYRDLVTLTARSIGTGDQDSISAINLLASATDALLTSFFAQRAGEALVLRWETAAEIGTLGYELYRRAHGAKSWTRVEPGPIAAAELALSGATYYLVDDQPAAGSSAYQLVEITVTGTKQLLGEPLMVAGNLPQTPRPEHTFRSEAKPPLPDQRAATTPPIAKATKAPISAARVSTRGDGLVRLGTDEIATALGRSAEEIEAAIGSGQIALRRGGVPVPWMADGDDVLFLARQTTSIYSHDDVVQLRLEPGIVMETAAGGIVFADGFETGDASRWTGDGSPVTVVQAVVRSERDLTPGQVLNFDPDGDFWHWDTLFPSTTKTFSIDSPAPAGLGSASLTVSFKGASTSLAPIDHQARVRIGGHEVGVTSWDGPIWHTATFAVPAALLGEGTTVIEITSEQLPNVPLGIFYVDEFTLEYQRRAELAAGRLEAIAPPPGRLPVAGISGQVLAFDMSDPNRPRRLAPDANGVDVPLGVEALLVQDTSTAIAPYDLQGDHPSSLLHDTNRANYLIIAGAGLEAAATQLASLREGSGFETMVVVIQDVYDEFSFGNVDAMAVQRLLAHAHQHWSLAPSHVVMFGDGSWDYRNILGLGPSLLLSPQSAAPQGLVGSDQRLADIDEDGIPDVVVGRLPWRTPAEAEAYLTHLVARDAGGAWSRTAVWVADKPDQGGEFPEDIDNLKLDALPNWNDIDIDRSRLSIEPARAALLEALSQGAGFVTYLGHGASSVLSNDHLLTMADAVDITNGSHRPIFVAMTCSFGRADWPLATLAEALILGTNGGAIAVISSTANQFNEDGKAIAGYLFDADGPETLGGALLRALRSWTAAGGDPAIARTFSVIGDPAMPFEGGVSP